MEPQTLNSVNKTRNIRDTVNPRPIRKLLATAVVAAGLMLTPASANALLGGPSDGVVITQIVDKPSTPQFDASDCMLSKACYEAKWGKSGAAKQDTKTWWDDVKPFLKVVSDRATSVLNSARNYGHPGLR